MVSELQSREYIRQAIGERLGQLKEEALHWLNELEKLDATEDGAVRIHPFGARSGKSGERPALARGNL
jgi:hypothetical protein